MPHPTSQGLSQEEGALSPLAQSHLPDLEKRGVTADYLTGYAAKTEIMEDTVAASSGKTSDKEQLTVSEAAAKDNLLADVRRIQGGVKRVFPNGSPQRKEFFVGEYFNHSTSILIKWATGIASAWDKYKVDLIGKGNLVQEDLDSMLANAEALKGVDSTQESAKHVVAPEATAAAQKSMADVETAADFIYGAARAAYAKNPQVLGEFEALKPLRYAVTRKEKNPPTQPPAN